MIRILIYLAIAAICGGLGARLAGASKKGCFVNIVLGFIGAMIGSWLSRQVDIPEILVIYDIPVFWSIIGSALFVAVVSMLSGGGSKRR